jgi:hypothetical protein
MKSTNPGRILAAIAAVLVVLAMSASLACAGAVHAISSHEGAPTNLALNFESTDGTNEQANVQASGLTQDKSGAWRGSGVLEVTQAGVTQRDYKAEVSVVYAAGILQAVHVSGKLGGGQFAAVDATGVPDPYGTRLRGQLTVSQGSAARKLLTF